METERQGQPSLLPIDVTFGPLLVNLAVGLNRLEKRQRCSSCSHRRVCFAVGVGGLVSSPPVCAKCAGIRR